MIYDMQLYFTKQPVIITLKRKGVELTIKNSI